MSTSQNGWPALSVNSKLLYTWKVPGTDTKLRLRNGSAGFLLVHLASVFDKRIEGLDEPLLDDWGYAFRPIRGFSTELSNHSSGTAMDLNSTDHPLGRLGTFNDREVELLHKFLSRRYKDCIRWGGDYRNRKDEMHFEINRQLSACERVARGLLATKRGKLIIEANPGQRAVILS